VNPEVFVKILDEKSIAGYSVIDDIFGQPVLILRVVMERDIFRQGYDTVIFFIYVVFLGSIFFLTTALTVFDRFVLSRITTLSKSVSNVRISGKLVDRVQTSGKDEISSLGIEINAMLDSLEIADDRMRLVRDELEKRVEDRTAQLTSVNEELKYEISERELGQRALFEAYNEIQLILSSISSIIIGVGSDQCIRQWNDSAVELFGLSSLDTVGKNFFDLPIHWDWEALSHAASQCTQHNQKVRVEDFLLEQPGAVTHILGITLSPLMEKDGEPPGFLLVGSDITERRRMEQQIGRANKLEAIGQMAAGVAHEINTPTQLVGSNLRFLGQQMGPVLDLVDRYGQLNQAVKTGTATRESAVALEKATAAAHVSFFRQEAPRAIQQSLEGIERISRIVSAMRFFMHPGSETKEFASLNKIIENALSLSRNEWKNVAEVITDLDPGLPDVECLPGDLSQVILNLVINAVHAIQDAGGEQADTLGQIHITSRPAGDFVELRIQDSGTGIPDEIRSKVFDLFFTTKDVGRGTGQGLSIAYTVIVKKHGGTIEFESEAGHGTTFIIRLPIKVNYDEQDSSG
jgi:PAS domain S-box-containing protein